MIFLQVMHLFEHKQTLASSQFFVGFTDVHCHLLPGVDDGIRKMEDCIELLHLYEQSGVRRVWFTPHIMEDIPNSTAGLRETFESVKSAYRGGIELHLSSENMLDSLFDERLRNGDLLTLGSGKLLVETSYFNPPIDMDDKLQAIMSKGLYPVLAHPERYIYMDMERYRYLHGKGVLFQLNLSSLYGSYGEQAQKKSLKLLYEGLYDLIGTDVHRISSFEHMLSARLPSKTIRSLDPLTLSNINII